MYSEIATGALNASWALFGLVAPGWSNPIAVSFAPALGRYPGVASVRNGLLYASVTISVCPSNPGLRNPYNPVNPDGALPLAGPACFNTAPTEGLPFPLESPSR